MNIITCDTEILQALDGSYTKRVDRYRLFGWNFYTHWWISEKKSKQ